MEKLLSIKEIKEVHFDIQGKSVDAWTVAKAASQVLMKCEFCDLLTYVIYFVI